MKTYDVSAEREGRWWLIRIPELDRVTQARRLDQVEYMARDLIAVWLEIPEDSFAIRTEVVLGDLLRREVDMVRAETVAASRHLEAAAAESRRLATHLVEAGFTVRDIGAILGVSPQRVSQLTSRKVVIAPVSKVRGKGAAAHPATPKG